MTHTAPQGLPPLPKPDTHCLDDDTQRDVWSYSAELVQSYAREALAAQAATLEAICKIIECAGPEAADEIADLLGYPSVEWLSDQALTAPNLACKSAQARLATQWGYVRAASVEPVGKIINSGGNTGSLPEHPLLVWLGGVPPVGTELYAGAPPAHIPADVEASGWCEYVAGMVGHWVRSDEYAGIKADEDRCTKAIAGIIERRLWALKHSPQPQAVVASSPAQAVDAVDGLREALRMGVECLRNQKSLHPEDFDELDELAVALLKAALATKEPK